jgi:hypothetical protein
MSSSSNYYDLDAILSEEELVPCWNKFDFSYLAHLDPDHQAGDTAGNHKLQSPQQSSSSPHATRTTTNLLPEGTKLKIPLWALRSWAPVGFVQMTLPRHYHRKAREKLQADPCQVDLRYVVLYWIGLHSYILCDACFARVGSFLLVSFLTHHVLLFERQQTQPPILWDGRGPPPSLGAHGPQTRRPTSGAEPTAAVADATGYLAGRSARAARLARGGTLVLVCCWRSPIVGSFLAYDTFVFLVSPLFLFPSFLRTHSIMSPLTMPPSPPTPRADLYGRSPPPHHGLVVVGRGGRRELPHRLAHGLGRPSLWGRGPGRAGLGRLAAAGQTAGRADAAGRDASAQAGSGRGGGSRRAVETAAGLRCTHTRGCDRVRRLAASRGPQ